jgi:hypothetical protein
MLNSKVVKSGESYPRLEDFIIFNKTVAHNLLKNI